MYLQTFFIINFHLKSEICKFEILNFFKKSLIPPNGIHKIFTIRKNLYQ